MRDPEVASDFRRQLLWLKAQEFAVDVAAVLKSLPQNREVDIIAGQLLRSAGSIAANIAEGYGRYSQAAYRNHLSIARGSAFESVSWLDLLVRSEYVPQPVGDKLINKCIEIQKLLTLRMKSLSEGKTYAVREEVAIYDVN